MDDRTDRQQRRERDLPEHERDVQRAVGGGIVGHGGTAIDRGTGVAGPERDSTIFEADVDRTSQRDVDDEESGLEEPLAEQPVVGSANAVLPAADDADVREGETAEDEARRRR